MSGAKKVVVVLGATGLQGGSVVTSLLNDGGYKVRALSRNPENEQGKALAARGVEVFKVEGSLLGLSSSFLFLNYCFFLFFFLFVSQ